MGHTSTKRDFTLLLCACIATALITSVRGQSTTTAPQAQCASYLNRYTQENQCIYSFIVPKKGSDHCPGLEDQIRTLHATVQELIRKQNQTERELRNIRQNEQNTRTIGVLEERVRLTEDKLNKKQAEYDALVATKDRLIEEKANCSRDLLSASDEIEDLRDCKPNLQNVDQEVRQLRLERDRLKQVNDELQRRTNCSDLNKHLPSCAVIKEWGYTTSGYAVIDPDGEGGVDPFQVYCDMDSDPSTGITVIQHIHEDDTPVNGCEGAGCFTRTIDYKGVKVEQIEKLVNISVACEQFIQYKCYDSKLLRGGTAWWVSRNKTKMSYWGGAAPGSNMCACGMAGTCKDTSELCNCDADTEEWLSDEGTLRDKNSLPVTQLNFGDVDDASGEKGKFTLGPLKCKWSVNISVPSCDALAKAGVQEAGTYRVDPDGSKGPAMEQMIHCNLQAGTNTSSVTVGSNIRPRNPNLYMFTDCGQKPGRLGPTEELCNTSYAGSNVYVRVSEGTQLWRVPKDGRYRINVTAPGGSHTVNPKLAGRGVMLTAEFKLAGGTQMRLVVGQKGLRSGGSGGSFVIKMHEIYTAIPLLISGAGGSSTASGSGYKSTDGSLDLKGKDASRTGTNVGHGGKDGNGGERGNRLVGANTPGGGAGFKTAGVASGDSRFGKPLPAVPIKGNGKGFAAPGVGGNYTYNGQHYDGGFGGGGCGTKNEPGGAGGYSGGGGGSTEGHSGGGGSYVRREDALSPSMKADNLDNGWIAFEYLGPAPEVAS